MSTKSVKTSQTIYLPVIRQTYSTFQSMSDKRQWKIDVGGSGGWFYDNLSTVMWSKSVPTIDRYIHLQLQAPHADDNRDTSAGGLVLWTWSHSVSTYTTPAGCFTPSAAILKCNPLICLLILTKVVTASIFSPFVLFIGQQQPVQPKEKRKINPKSPNHSISNAEYMMRPTDFHAKILMMPLSCLGTTQIYSTSIY